MFIILNASKISNLTLMVIDGLLFQLGFRPERCKSRVGNHSGLQKIKKVIHTAILVGIGKPENGEIGIHVLISLAKSHLISYLSKFNCCSLGLSILSHFSPMGGK